VASEAPERDQILARFGRWLDEALASEPLPPGIAPELLSDNSAGGTPNPTDAFAMWSAITALTQETRLQGRGFKDLTDAVSAQPGRVAEEIRASYRERERELAREAERKCRREVLDGLLDLRESLERGLRVASTPAPVAPRPWYARWSGAAPQPDPQAEATRAALLKGYELTLQRLDRMLFEWNVQPVDALGEQFDPQWMNAVDIEESTLEEDGTVLEVYRTGFEWNGAVFRTAQVRVARAPARVAHQGEAI